MLKEGLNIFSDYVRNNINIDACKYDLELRTQRFNEIESNFGEEVSIVQIMEHNRVLSEIENFKNELAKIENEQSRLANEIKEFFRKYPKTKRISLRSNPPYQQKEWGIIDLFNDQIRIQTVNE